MMRVFLAAMFFCALLAPAHAGWMIPQAVSDRTRASAGAHVARVWSSNRNTGPAVVVAAPLRGALSAACQVARALGGPCGCFASEYFFGHSVRELWLANAWLSFPHVAPAAGTAAVWPGRHVAPVVADNNDGTVTVRDSWNPAHRVSARGLVFVDPRGGLPAARTRRARYAQL
jgi:hypothetical protein